MTKTLEEALAAIPAAVARGVEWLEAEKRRPDWARELKESLQGDPCLDMGDCELCVCGRVFGDFWDVWGADPEAGARLGFGPATAAVDDDYATSANLEAYYAALAKEWLRVMHEKLEEKS